MKPAVKQVGITTDDKPVLSGLYYMRETFGLPLDLLVLEVHRNGAMVDWTALLNEMRAARVKNPIPEIFEAAVAAFGRSFADVVRTRLEAL